MKESIQPVEHDEDYEDFRCSQRDIAFARLSTSIHHFFQNESVFERITTLNEVFGHALQSTDGDVNDDGTPVYALSNIDVIDLFNKHVQTMNFFLDLHCVNETIQKYDLMEWSEWALCEKGVTGGLTKSTE